MIRTSSVTWVLTSFLAVGCGRSNAGTDTAPPPTPAPSADVAGTDLATAPTRTLTIRWQRLITDGGTTCPRCAGTEGAIREAEQTLRPALSALGIRVVVEEGTLDMATFKGNPSESNRIWIGGKTLEEILGGSAGSSQCCGACGDSDCRTLVLDGRTYEAVPADLIVRAALKAAADLLGPTTQESGSPSVPPAATIAEPPAPGGSCGCGSAPALVAPPPPAPSCGEGGPATPSPCCGGSAPAAPATPSPCCGAL